MVSASFRDVNSLHPGRFQAIDMADMDLGRGPRKIPGHDFFHHTDKKM